MTMSTIRYRFALTGTPSREWDVVVEGDTAHMVSATETSPVHATFACDGETFALLMCGRVGWDKAIANKQVITTGDMASVQAFNKWFPGV